MADGSRYALLAVAGLMAVLLVVSFTAYGLTTYGSIREIVGDLMARPDRAASLQDQYHDMAAQFSGGSTNTYTYHLNSATVNITRPQVAGMDETGVISLVLDTYTAHLYNGELSSGSPGPAGILFTASGNIIYAILTLVFAIMSVGFAALTIREFNDCPKVTRIKDAGKAIAASGLLAFLVFAFAPGLIKSLLWGSISNTSTVGDALSVVEPGAMGSLLRNMLILALIGAIIYGGGFYLEIQGENEKPRHYSYSAKQGSRQNRKRRSL